MKIRQLSIYGQTHASNGCVLKSLPSPYGEAHAPYDQTHGSYGEAHARQTVLPFFKYMNYRPLADRVHLGECPIWNGLWFG